MKIIIATIIMLLPLTTFADVSGGGRSYEDGLFWGADLNRNEHWRGRWGPVGSRSRARRSGGSPRLSRRVPCWSDRFRSGRRAIRDGW